MKTKEEILAKHFNTQFYSNEQCELVHNSTDIKHAMLEYANEVLDEYTNLTKGITFNREDVRRSFIKDFKEKLK